MTTPRDIKERIVGFLTSKRFVAFVILVCLFGAAAGALYLSYLLNGLINTVVYAFVLVFAATIIPMSITLFGAGIPGSSSLGRAHIVLGAFAFNHHYLVEREDRWEWCPGDEGRVYIDGEWHDLDGGEEHKSVLGWRPFGILRYKTDDTWANERVDNQAEQSRVSTTDGGVSQANPELERGGWSQAEKPTVTGRGSRWLLDLKRVYSSGIRKMGDIELIETAEEIIERGQVDDGTLSGFGPAITFIVSLILGIVVGAGVLFLG